MENFDNLNKLISIRNLIMLDETTQQYIRILRNKKSVAKYFQIEYIDQETHNNFINQFKKYHNKNWGGVIYFNNSPIGLTYFRNIDGIKADWGIFIEENFRGKNIGSLVLKYSISYAKDVLNLKIINLEVLDTNLTAIHLYKKYGFVKMGEHLITKNDNIVRILEMSLLLSDLS